MPLQEGKKAGKKRGAAYELLRGVEEPPLRQKRLAPWKHIYKERRKDTTCPLREKSETGKDQPLNRSLTPASRGKKEIRATKSLVRRETEKSGKTQLWLKLLPGGARETGGD